MSLREGREGIFVRSELMETFMRLDIMGWDSPGFKGWYRERAAFEPVYIRCAFGQTLGKLYGVEQWPNW